MSGAEVFGWTCGAMAVVLAVGFVILVVTARNGGSDG